MKASAKIFAALCCALAAATSRGAQIVENGACDIAVVLPRNAGEADARAANVLARELAKLARSGLVKVSFQEGANARAKTRIFLKKSGEPFDIRGGNSIRVKSGSESVEISYPDGSRAMNAAGLFLRKLCSMRFYAPGELGTHFERRENFEIPEGEFEYEDAFACADFHAATRNPRDREKVREWLGLNGAHSVGGGFSHNMKNIFDADFLRAHPEISARRRDGSPKPRSQPDLLNPLAAGRAAKKAGEFFAEKPFAKMFPMGIGDYSEFDERAPTLARKRGYFRGFPDYSEAVFEFSAKAARLVAKEHPGKFVGCIAYLACEKPPPFKLPQNLVPYFTTDRANYFDAKYKAEDFKALDEWGKAAQNFGIYDYAYGAPYPLPREIGGEIACGIARAHRAGARLYYAELNPIFAYDAKKCAEIFAAIETPSDAGAPKRAAEEFFKNFYGPAAGAVERFFGTAERAWIENRARRGDATRWLGLFKLESSAEIFSDADIEEMSGALSDAALAARPAKFWKYAARVKLLENAFDFGKKCREEYFLKRKIFERINAGESPEKVERLVRGLRAASEKKSEAFAELENAGDYPAPAFMEMMFTENLDPSVQAAEYLLAKGADGNSLGALFSEEEIALAKASAGGAREAAEIDGSFEGSGGGDLERLPVPRAWLPYECDYDGASMAVSKRAARSGKYGAEFLMCENSAISAASKISEGDILIFDGYYRGRITPGTACYATIVFFGNGGKYLGRKTSLFHVSGGEKFSRFLCAARAPKGSQTAVASLFASRMKEGDFLFADDLRLRKADGGN